MALSDSLEFKLKQIEKVFTDYCEEVSENQQKTTGSYTNVLVNTIEVKPLGRLDNVVGVNKAKLMRNQWNDKPKNYAKYYYYGHKPAMVAFRRQVPNSKQSKTTGLWWHYFPKSDGHDGINEALEKAGSLPDRISEVIRG